jgi:hypothetical protein
MHSILFSLVAVLGLLSAVSDDTDDKKNPNSIDWPAILAPERPLATSKKPKPSSPPATPPKFVWPKGLDGKPLYDPNLFETDPDIFIRDRIAKSTRFTEDSSESVWSDFRRKFPYLIQGIAIRRGNRSQVNSFVRRASTVGGAPRIRCPRLSKRSWTRCVRQGKVASAFFSGVTVHS